MLRPHGRNFCRTDTIHFVAKHCSYVRHQNNCTKWTANPQNAHASSSGSISASNGTANGDNAASNGAIVSASSGIANAASSSGTANGDNGAIVAVEKSQCQDIELLTCQGYPVGSGSATVDGVQHSAGTWVILCCMATIETKTSKGKHGSFETRSFVLYVYSPKCKLPRSSSGIFKSNREILRIEKGVRGRSEMVL